MLRVPFGPDTAVRLVGFPTAYRVRPACASLRLRMVSWLRCQPRMILMCALCQLGTSASKFGTLGGRLLKRPAERHRCDDHDKYCNEQNFLEPSPSSGEKPKCRSMKSIGATLLRSTQSSTAPQTAMIEAKPISTPRVVRSTASSLCPRQWYKRQSSLLRQTMVWQLSLGSMLPQKQISPAQGCQKSDTAVS